MVSAATCIVTLHIHIATGDDPLMVIAGMFIVTTQNTQMVATAMYIVTDENIRMEGADISSGTGHNTRGETTGEQLLPMRKYKPIFILRIVISLMW